MQRRCKPVLTEIGEKLIMTARLFSMGLFGLETYTVEVEADISLGRPLLILSACRIPLSGSPGNGCGLR